MTILPTIRGALSGNVLDPDAGLYIAALAGVGTTASSLQRRELHAFFRREKSFGRWDLLKRFYLPIWGSAAANALCLKSLTSGTFVGNVTHNLGSVSTTAPTGHFLANSTPASLGINQADASIFNLLFSGIHDFSGCGGASNSRLLTGRVGGTNRSFIPSSTSGVGTSSDSTGIFIGSRIGSELSLFQRRASGWIAPQTATTADTTALPLFAPAFVGNFNNNGSVSTGRLNPGTYGAYGYGLGMTAAQAEAFSLSLKKLSETATGLTLP